VPQYFKTRQTYEPVKKEVKGFEAEL